MSGVDEAARQETGLYADRRWWVVGLGLWVVGCIGLVLHALHVGAMAGALFFVTVESWLIGLACVGAPILALRVLGRRLTPSGCLLMGVGFTACAVLLTLLFAMGAFTPMPVNAAFGLIIFLAPAIHCVNAAEVLRGVAAARREHRTDCVMAEAMTEHELAEALAPLPQEQRAWILRMLTVATQAQPERHLRAVDEAGRGCRHAVPGPGRHF